MHEGGDAGGLDRGEHPRGALHVDAAHLVRVVRGLQQPGEVDDDVGAGDDRQQVVLGDVEGVPLDARVGASRQPAGDPTTEVTSGASSSWGRSWEPTLPVAPVTTMRMPERLPRPVLQGHSAATSTTATDSPGSRRVPPSGATLRGVLASSTRRRRPARQLAAGPPRLQATATEPRRTTSQRASSS